jgi:hypothetical protein
MNADRACDVLDGLLPHVFETKTELVAHLIMYHGGNHDPAGISEGFESRSNVDAVAENIVAIDDNVADIDTDSELDAGWLR